MRKHQPRCSDAMPLILPRSSGEGREREPHHAGDQCRTDSMRAGREAGPAPAWYGASRIGTYQLATSARISASTAPWPRLSAVA